METILANRYRVLQRLGGGGFGQTFLAKDAHLPGNPLCVVKKLQPKFSDRNSLQIAKKLFDREAETLYKLGEHPQIPRLFAHFEENNEFYLVQEYIQGRILTQELVRGKPWTEERTLALVKDILKVLVFVHDRDIIHRDIKPANLIRRESDRSIILIDFGAVKEVSQVTSISGETSYTVVIGSPLYMPSEQQAAKPHFSSDLYAVGIIAMQALSGLHATEFPRDRHDELNCNLLQTPIPISDAFSKFLTKITRYDYRQRYQNATFALQSLERLFHDCNTSSADATTQPLLVSQPEVNSPIPESDRTQLPPESLPIHTLSREEFRNRQILINKVKNYWIKGVLENSLHGRVLLELGIEERPEAIAKPWGMVWETSERDRENLSSKMRAIDKFDELGLGRTLLILGEPGSGKTTTLLELACDLIKRREVDLSQPLPVIFNLSSWLGEKQSIQDWLIEELHCKYQVSPELGKVWVKEQQLLLLLDGLDEVNSEKQQNCVKSLNQFCQNNGQTELVVCCRRKDYERLDQYLCFQGAIYLQPLTVEQIRLYLSAIGSGLTAIHQALNTDESLQELARSPLMLSIMTLAYRGANLQDLPSQNASELRRNLFNTYIERMFNRRFSEQIYPKQKARRWLIHLAKQMMKESQTVFLIERMQPEWLKTQRKRWSYSLGVGLLGGLISGAFTGINLTLTRGIGNAIAVSLILGLCGGIVVAVVFGFIIPNIEPVEMVKWSSVKAKEAFLPGMRVGIIVAIVSLFAYLCFGWFLGWNRYWIEGCLYGISGLGSGVVFILLRGLTGGGIQRRTIPNQGIWQSAKNMAFFALIGVLALSPLAGLLGLPLLFGAIFGLVFGMASPAGIACLQHLTLRIILYFDRSIPWNYARFLDYATQLIFMQKVGGGYIFIHRLLLEHFATLN
ncbi:MAG: protein kinase [Cyanobacteria bacterium SBLK]|nr:protein kinase [Cyanobacteria bacterium SBLK]